MAGINRSFVCILIVSAVVALAYGQSSPDETQILANLRYRIPEIRDANLEMKPLVPSDFDGFFQGSVIIDGKQQAHFLFDPATEQLLLLLSPVPIAVGLDTSEVAELLENEERLAAIQDAERHQELLAFAEGMAFRGPADAPVTIFEFSDFQCPYCARGFEVIEELLSRYPNEVRFVYLHLPLTGHNWARPAAIAAVCAARQADDAFWALHDNYFRNQRQVTQENVMRQSREFLNSTGIDMDAWATCAGDAASEGYLSAAQEVEESVRMAETVFDVSGTPGFFVNGRFLGGAQPLETFEKLIEEFGAVETSHMP